ncbi:unnamed protein product [Rotaria sp. Silwood2]|nr:unnamed protein product [Rotaria sp. Silwood2]
MNETIDDNKIESQSSIIHVVEGSIASRTKEITKQPKRERSSTVQILPPAPKIKKDQRDAQQRIFGPIRRFYYRSFRIVSKLCTFTEEEKSNVDSLELCSILAYSCLKPKVRCFDKKPPIFVLDQLIRNGNAFLHVKGSQEHVSIISKPLKPPKIMNTIGSTKQTNRTLSKHVKILLNPLSANVYMRVGLSCRYRHVGILLSCSTTHL